MEHWTRYSRECLNTKVGLVSDIARSYTQWSPNNYGM